MKSLTYSALIAASLALTGNAAMAATTTVHQTATTTTVGKPVKPHVARTRVTIHVATRRQYPRGNYYPFDLGQFLQSLGVPTPYAQYARDAAAYYGLYAAKSGGRDSGTYDSSYSSPTYDTSTPIDNSAELEAQQAAEMASEENAQATMQLDQELNDEANAEANAGIAAGVQDEIQANQ
jgi:hypothetical protein